MVLRPVKVTITKKDIREGIKGDAINCPLARALTRMTGLPWAIGVSFGWVDDEGIDLHVELPEKVADFIFDFDKGKISEKNAPFTGVIFAREE